MTSSVKIFRPWTSVKEDGELMVSETKIVERTNLNANAKLNLSVYARVPEPGYPIAEFAAAAAAAAAGSGWHGLPVGFDDCWSNSGVQMLPYQTADSLAHSLSYLDSAYLDAIYGSAKVSKLKQRPKKFRCPHCKVSFSNNGQLKGHVRIHTGERPFKCDAEKCGKSFTRNEELTRHKRIHTGLRPFPCDQCGKRFGRKDHLKKHVRTHYPQPRFLDANLVSLYPVLFGY